MTHSYSSRIGLGKGLKSFGGSRGQIELIAVVDAVILYLIPLGLGNSIDVYVTLGALVMDLCNYLAT